MIADAKRKGLWVMAEDMQSGGGLQAAKMASAFPGPAGFAGTMISVAAPFITGEPKPPEGSFTFSPEELNKIIDEWEDLRTSLDNDERQAMYMTNIQPPGNDFASGDFSNAANPSGEEFRSALRKMIDYVDRYIEALKNARDKISAQDEQSQGDIAKAGGTEV